MCTTRRGLVPGLVVSTLGPFAMFYVATWEEYYTGELILPIINGPNEGLLGGALLSLTTCFYPDFWQSPFLSDALGLQQLLSSPLRNADIQVSLAVFGILRSPLKRKNNMLVLCQFRPVGSFTRQPCGRF